MNNVQRVLGVVAGIAVSASAALAQPGGGRGGFFGGQNTFSPAVTPTELETYAEILGLDEEQHEVAKILLEGYIQQFQTRAGEARNRMQRLQDEARESRDREQWAAIGEYRAEFETEAGVMEKALFSDLRAVLTPEQSDRWEDLERTRRRQRTLGRGQMSGERVDMIRITDELELGEDSRGSIREVLAQYELDLDRALIRRNDTYDTMRGQFRGGRGGFDRDAIGDLMEKSRDASRRVREVNDRYARQISGLLGDDLRGGFDKRVREASFPQVYRETRAQRALSAAAGFEDLSEEQGERIAALASGFGREASTMNDRLAGAWREAEDSMEIRDMFRGGMNRGELGEMREKRNQLDESYMGRLREVLSEEQLDRLPRNEDRQDFRQRGGQRDRRRGEII